MLKTYKLLARPLSRNSSLSIASPASTLGTWPRHLSFFRFLPVNLHPIYVSINYTLDYVLSKRFLQASSFSVGNAGNVSVIFKGPVNISSPSKKVLSITLLIVVLSFLGQDCFPRLAPRGRRVPSPRQNAPEVCLTTSVIAARLKRPAQAALAMYCASCFLLLLFFVDSQVVLIMVLRFPRQP